MATSTINAPFHILKTFTYGTDQIIEAGYVRITFSVSTPAGYMPKVVVSYNLNDRDLCRYVHVSAVVPNGVSEVVLLGYFDVRGTLSSGASVTVLYEKV